MDDLGPHSLVHTCQTLKRFTKENSFLKKISTEKLSKIFPPNLSGPYC